MSHNDRYGPPVLIIGLLFFGVWLGYAGFGGRSSQITPPIGSGPIIEPSYPSTRIFEASLGGVEPPETRLGNPVVGVVVNHHLLAAGFISHTLVQARGQGIDRIILLSPNHFSLGRGRIISTFGSFVTPFGPVRVDESAVRTLVVTGAVQSDAAPFGREHGVSNILPYLKKLYPSATIVPVITKDATPAVTTERVRRALARLVTPRTLVVASLDFAHGQTNTGAMRLDERTLVALRQVNPENVSDNPTGLIAVDSPPTLRMFLGLMSDRGARTFTLWRHSNSALETGRLDAVNVTSHITGLFTRFPIVLH